MNTFPANQSEKESEIPVVIRKWLSGIPYEIAFWESYYRNAKRFRDLMEWSQYGKECVLDEFDIAGFIRTQGPTPIILDVGCALSYMLSGKIEGKFYPIYYLDPLAVHYNSILRKTRKGLPPITFGMGETLSIQFAVSSVDFIHIRNSIDHGADPMLTIWQSLIILKPGGVLYLNHKPNEAINEGYRGFHQFNMDCVNNRGILWNKSTCLDIAEILNDYADVTTVKTKEGRIVTVIVKKAEIPAGHPAFAQGIKFANEFNQQILSYFHSLGNSLRYQLQYLFTSSAHTVMRLLPYTFVNKLKKILATAHPRKELSGE